MKWKPTDPINPRGTVWAQGNGRSALAWPENAKGIWAWQVRVLAHQSFGEAATQDEAIAAAFRATQEELWRLERTLADWAKRPRREWTGPRPADWDDTGSFRLADPVPPERWPWGPPELHQTGCRLWSGGLYCDCACSVKP